MLDDSDADFAVLSVPDGNSNSALGAILGIIALVIAVGIMVAVHYNHKECAQKHCERGEPILANHECLCAEKAK